MPHRVLLQAYDQVSDADAKHRDDYDRADAYLRNDPEVQDALMLRVQLLTQNPLTAAYYQSLSNIEQFFKQKMHRQAEKLFGADLWQLFDVFSQLNAADKNASRKFWKDHPQLEGYMNFKEQYYKEFIELAMLLAKPYRRRRGLFAARALIR